MDQPDAGLWLTLAHDVLQNWHNTQFRSPPLEQTLLFRQTVRSQPGAPLSPAQLLINQALTQLVHSYPDDAALLHARFIRELPPHQVAKEREVAQSTLFRFQRRALERLADVLVAADEEARRLYLRLLEQRLEPATTGLHFGITEQVESLTKVLTTPGEPWVVCIEGIGGIGKTTLANAVVRQLIGHPAFTDIAWVSIQPRISNPLHAWMPANATASNEEAVLKAMGEQLLGPTGSALLALPAQLRTVLHERLHAAPHLIAIDNLETPEDLASIRPLIQRLVGPSKFLLTSRFSPPQEGAFFSYHVRELSELAARLLVRFEAQRRNAPDLAAASDADLAAIYHTVGGNPLALRLVVGQGNRHGLRTVLHDLHEARGQTADHLYTYIFWHAWRHLDQLARSVLVAMPLAPLRGASLDYLQAITELEPGALIDALNGLLSQNLVDSYGDLQERRYTIHSLTRTFLLEQVTKWLPGYAA